ncbi:hypothetical protein OJAV_G00078670 [Oryzias javanicus]|uniref:Saposin B-type domain-containing protein n=1 Tax=Oryzias javanicus TaxID=123683 RepID=A0A437D3T8_ORYJA|nr:hypothetical protein OJAV_G00078670 [Oryzias javanicus]
MNIFVFFICMLYFVPTQAEKKDRHMYCESCLKAAQVMEKIIKETPSESRQRVAEKLLAGELCSELLSYNQDHVSKDKMLYACRELLDSHRDQFHAAVAHEEPKNLPVVMCFEQSHACVGVKQKSQEDSKVDFAESEIEALLHKHKKNVRIAHPVNAHSDEL